MVGKNEYTAFVNGYREGLEDYVWKLLNEVDLTYGFAQPVPNYQPKPIQAVETIETAEVEPVPVETVEPEPLDEKIQEVLEIRTARFNDRKERRIERYQDLAQKHEKLSDAAYNQSKQMASAIPFGQPILVGHHSEGRDRRYRAKIRKKMHQSVEHSRTAEHYANKAKSAELNHAIRSDDPDAIANLKARIAELERSQESMKAANKIVKSKKLTKEQKIEQLNATGHNGHDLMNPRWGGDGYAGYQLTNNNANIRRLKERLIELERSLIVAADLGDTETEYPQHELVVVHARSINRLQLKFDGKPPESIRSILKSNGFRWAPSEMAWQRFLPNSEWALKRTLEELDKAIALCP
jgi:Domain of unknown function (DUF3560)